MAPAGGLSGALAASLAGALIGSLINALAGTLVTASEADWFGDGTRTPSTKIAPVTPRATGRRTRTAALTRRGAMTGIGRVDDNKR